MWLVQYCAILFLIAYCRIKFPYLMILGILSDIVVELRSMVSCCMHGVHDFLANLYQCRTLMLNVSQLKIRQWTLNTFFGIVVRIDTVLSFMYDMYVRRMGLFDHDYGLRLLELGCRSYRYCFKLYV